MEELELLREMDKRGLQVQRAAEELCQAAAGLAVKFEGESGYWVPAEEFHELQRALKVVHDYALEVATGRRDNSPEGLRGEQDPLDCCDERCGGKCACHRGGADK